MKVPTDNTHVTYTRRLGEIILVLVKPEAIYKKQSREITQESFVRAYSRVS
jgi:hypothetical protein